MGYWAKNGAYVYDDDDIQKTESQIIAEEKERMIKEAESKPYEESANTRVEEHNAFVDALTDEQLQKFYEMQHEYGITEEDYLAALNDKEQSSGKSR